MDAHCRRRPASLASFICKKNSVTLMMIDILRPAAARLREEVHKVSGTVMRLVAILSAAFTDASVRRQQQVRSSELIPTSSRRIPASSQLTPIHPRLIPTHPRLNTTHPQQS